MSSTSVGDGTSKDLNVPGRPKPDLSILAESPIQPGRVADVSPEFDAEVRVSSTPRPRPRRQTGWKAWCHVF